MSTTPYGPKHSISTYQSAQVWRSAGSVWYTAKTAN